MPNVYDILIRPIITERSMAATSDKKYVFEVAPTAGKIEIKNAVEKIFEMCIRDSRTNNGKRISQYTCSQYTKVPCGTLCKTQHRIRMCFCPDAAK